ncbi:MAG: carboxypeptidase regulatory-like domain-containing protein [Luteibaculaceae bacterium]
MRKFYLVLLLLFIGVSGAYAQTGQSEIQGKVTDQESGETIPFANIIIEMNGKMVAGTTSDFDGKYIIKPVPPGKYDVKVSSVGYGPRIVEGVTLLANQIRFLNVDLKAGIEMAEFEKVEYKVPLIEKDGGSRQTITREDIARMPGRDATSMATTVAGVSTPTGGGVTMRGARTENTYFYIDGIKVRGSSTLPKAAIEEVQVITGGVPANYGDATGGIISITTRGASSTFFGGIDYLTSGFNTGDDQYFGFDNQGFNLIEGNLSGPLIWKKDSAGNKVRPIAGFAISGNYTNIAVNRPSGIDVFRLRPEVRDQMVQNPLVIVPGIEGARYSTEFLRRDDFQRLNGRDNLGSVGANANARLDFTLSEDVNLSLGGSIFYQDRAGQGGRGDLGFALMNAANNPQQIVTDWRVFGRLTQRFQDKNKDRESKNLISNAYYSLMVDYSRNTFVRQDPVHRDNLFAYGHVGTFDILSRPTYEPVFDISNEIEFWRQDGIQDFQINFTPSPVNSDLAAIGSQFFDFFPNAPDLNFVLAQGALRNGDAVPSTHGFLPPPGTPFNQFLTQSNSQFRVSGIGSANIGGHAIQLGFEYEQRSDRGFSVAPRGLWTQARLLANSHIREFDTDNLIATDQLINGIPVFNVNRIIAGGQSAFDRNLRISLGLDPGGNYFDAAGNPINDPFINIDGLDPTQLNLSMFSADELLNNGNNFVTYWGYDHTGRRTSGRPSFADFFNQRDESGNFTRPIAAFEPIYIAGYIMDKFSFDDLIFNVGLRIDRFDANQPVLRDPWLLKEARTAADVDFIGNNPVAHPANIGRDFVVYVDNINEPTQIRGYRSGDRWFNAQGEAVESTFLRVGGEVQPFLFEPEGDEISFGAFEQYTPRINVMPRIAFAFPISDEANFTAHYDILTQRPESGVRINPIDFLFLREVGNRAINNPDLAPSITIDYEVGFQQVLTKTSSLKIAAYYREMRNMVQVIQRRDAWPATYTTFGNVDFGTVKGMALTYDLRQTGNIWARITYNLQFADGTGSDPSTALNIINAGQGNLRTVLPLDFDQRHRITATLDYRYGQGRNYNGPTLFGKKLFENTGANFVVDLGSGTPYSVRGINVNSFENVFSPLAGTINGSRMPWQFRTDLQIDRNFVFEVGQEGEKKKKVNFNVYFQINNLFNTLNIIQVYETTGNPLDDGFLNDPRSIPQVSSSFDPQSFVDLYSLRLLDPFNFTIPRTIRLGLRFDF